MMPSDFVTNAHMDATGCKKVMDEFFQYVNTRNTESIEVITNTRFRFAKNPEFPVNSAIPQVEQHRVSLTVHIPLYSELLGDYYFGKLKGEWVANTNKEAVHSAYCRTLENLIYEIKEKYPQAEVTAYLKWLRDAARRHICPALTEALARYCPLPAPLSDPETEEIWRHSTSAAAEASSRYGCETPLAASEYSRQQASAIAGLSQAQIDCCGDPTHEFCWNWNF